jgi:hypothetical protein
VVAGAPTLTDEVASPRPRNPDVMLRSRGWPRGRASKGRVGVAPHGAAHNARQLTPAVHCEPAGQIAASWRQSIG